MNNALPKISKAIDQKNIHWCLEENYNSLSIDWLIIVEKWMFNSYSVFKDHEKYLILIYLVKKTFDYYAINFVKLSWKQFFALKKIEVGKFSIIDVAKELKISKETTRRKIEQLKKDNIIKKTKFGIVFQTTFFNNKFNQDNKDFLKLICSFASKFSVLLTEKKIVKEKIKSDLIEKAVIENFSSAWKMFFEMQIPFLIDWKVFFGDLETCHIWKTSLLNQNYEIQKNFELKKSKIKKLKDFFETHTKIRNNVGINAMSISNITGIPRATVIRKLKNLIKTKHLVIDNKKLYYPSINNYEDSSLVKLTTVSTQRLSIFLCNLLNLTIISK